MATVTIPQRRLRNDYAQILRDVRAGTTFVVTDRDVPVARILPASSPSYVRAQPPGEARKITRVTLSEPTDVVLDELRGDR
ncbi:MAG: hypothetical protein LBH13_10650 [Cellulomonadaceae bacterium]|nr:hypothetical protein [Cellulomonadaceae bacterium]